MEGKQTKGKQKIKMKMVEDEEDRLITFSKRRSGIYKKASELSTLCGAEVGVVVFSPSGKPFSFASPSMDYIANRFLNQNPLDDNEDESHHHLVEAHRRLMVEELNENYNQLLNNLEAERAKGKELRRMIKAIKGEDEAKGWWETPVEELAMDELEELNETLANFHLNVTTHISETRGFNFVASSSSAHNEAAEPSARQAGINNQPFVPNDASDHDQIDPSNFFPN
ncbi:hypothetical protein FNV43_RR05982 [Rhamnella rubrinervis]|uniref:MADS-box domain-containing protein n=1 Tax=Rhamnella rubrinervis TaxID=2594499 RepID=A0A8K0MLC3_9ROSA|nr:hypothetical protein FNV43_RR05982 [Rhamnella rubrinervis]